MSIFEWLAVLTAGILGFAGGHYRLKWRIFRNVTRLTDEERVMVTNAFRAGKVRASTRHS